MIWSIISIILFWLIWIRVIRQVVSSLHKKTLIITSARAICYTILVFIIYNLTYFLPELSSNIVTSIIVASIVFFVAVPILPTARKSRVIQSIFRIFTSIWVWWQVGTYTLSARWEESLKRSSLKNFQSWLLQSMILWAIISWIAFWVTENIIYMIVSFLQTNNISNAFHVFSERSFLPILVHIWSLSLWFISIIQLKRYIWQSWLVWILWFVITILSHLLYNIWQAYDIKLLSSILIIGYIITLHYALFKSDTLYIWQTPQERQN